MRIAHFVSAFPVLSETFVQDEILAFAKEGIENIVVTLRPPPKEIRSQEDEDRLLGGRDREDLGIVDILDPRLEPSACFRATYHWPRQAARVAGSLTTAGLSCPKESLRLAVVLHRSLEAALQLRKLKVDHLHAHFAHYPASMAWACSRLLGLPFTWNAHSYDLHQYHAHLPVKARDADRVFPISDYNRKAILDRAPGLPDLESRIEISRCGIDLDRYTFDHRGEVSAGAEEVPRVVAVGRLSEEKGFPTLVEAVKILMDRKVEVRAEIVGEGAERKRVESRIRDLGLGERVELAGALSRDETRERQRQADLAVQPCCRGSHAFDGIPVVLIEAMALGTPVISTDFSAIPELIEDGVQGRLVPPEDPTALAAAIEEALDSPDSTRAMAKKAREKIVREYDAPANYAAKARSIRDRLSG